MASARCGEGLLVLELSDPSAAVIEEAEHGELTISTCDISNWNVDLILTSKVVKVEAERRRLIEKSSYFRGLLGGNFSESNLDRLVIHWNLESFLTILRYIYKDVPGLTSNNFLHVLEGALFFGVDALLLECEAWLGKMTNSNDHLKQFSLVNIAEVWIFCMERGICSVPTICEGWLAANFRQAISSKCFVHIPYGLLNSCVEHPQLSVESEQQLCEALFLWLSNYLKTSSFSPTTLGISYFDMLKKVRINLLPLAFATRQRRFFPEFSNECLTAVLHLVQDSQLRASLLHAVSDDKLHDFKMRLTKYSEKVVLSGCVQMTVAILFLVVFPDCQEARLKNKLIQSLIELDYISGGYHPVLEKDFDVLTFEAVNEVDISQCSKLHIGGFIKWLQLSFPSLKMLRGRHLKHFKMDDMFYLIEKCSSLEEIDLSIDISPIVSSKVSILSCSSEVCRLSSSDSYRRPLGFNVLKHALERPFLPKVRKLTLAGRKEITDSDLRAISFLSDSLSYLNIMGCTLVTDIGISELIRQCLYLHSILASYTSFGRKSIQELCSDRMLCGGVSSISRSDKYSGTLAFNLQQLDIHGCTGVKEGSMLQLMSNSHMLQILNLKETCLSGDILCRFMGSALESLDVSETMVSLRSLVYVVKRNVGMRCLKATGCPKLHSNDDQGGGMSFEDLLIELGKKCILEEVAFGWGFSSSTLKRLELDFRELKAITLGLGASQSHEDLCRLPMFSPSLESVRLTFQVISDYIVRSILEGLPSLRVLELCCCVGDLSLLSFHVNMPNLKTLRLEWVAPGLTNDDLAALTENCMNLVELSLSGCKLLNADSQQIISVGWPGLSTLHLQNCGTITSDGVSCIFDCKAIEDLLLHHNGSGIHRKFICDAVSKFPLIRHISLDFCDACEGGFESPSFKDGIFLSTVRMSRCKSKKCGFDLPEYGVFKPVYKETIVLEWNYKELRTTVVEGRI